MTRYSTLLHYWNHLHGNYGLALLVIGIVCILVMLCNGCSLITRKTLPDGGIKEIELYTPLNSWPLYVLSEHSSLFHHLSSDVVLVSKPLMHQKNDLNSKCDCSGKIVFKDSTMKIIHLFLLPSSTSLPPPV
jgi:hypothetical protein